jgi:hypothetical protein
MADTPTVIASSNQSVPKNLGKTFGESGTLIMGGIITGEEYNNRLRGKYALKMFDIMRKSEESVRAALQMVKLPLLNQTNSIQPADDSVKSDFRKRFIERELFNRNVDYDKLKREGLTFADFGHSLCEVTYEMTRFEGVDLIGIKDIGFRKQTSIFKWETQTGLPGITQLLTAPIDGGNTLRDIIRQKLILWTNDQEGDNYEGISLLRYAFKSWDMADKLGLVHAMGLEKMAIPTPVLGVPAGADPQDEANAIAAIQQYRANEKSYIKKPVGWELTTFDLSGQSISELLPALEHYETKILLSVLGQFLMMGAKQSGSGSRATSQDHSKLFMLSEESFSRTFNGSVQHDLINTLEDLNFSDVNETGYSKLKTSAVAEDDIQILSDALQKLQSASLITPTFETEQHLRTIAKMPKLPDDYEADYEAKRQLSLNPPTPIIADPNAPPVDPQKAKDAKTKAAINAARQSQRQLIDVILG